MAKYIVYKGSADQFRFRMVDDAGNTVIIDDVHQNSGLFPTKEECISALMAHDPNAVIEDRTPQPEQEGDVNG